MTYFIQAHTVCYPQSKCELDQNCNIFYPSTHCVLPTIKVRIGPKLGHMSTKHTLCASHNQSVYWTKNVTYFIQAHTVCSSQFWSVLVQNGVKCMQAHSVCSSQLQCAFNQNGALLTPWCLFEQHLVKKGL